MCVDNRDVAGAVTMLCVHNKTVQIGEVILWRANSDTNCENIDFDDKSRYYCQSLFSLRPYLRGECNGRRNCMFEPKYREWHNCAGQDDVPIRPIILEIEFECVSCEYLIPPPYYNRIYSWDYWQKKGITRKNLNIFLNCILNINVFTLLNYI